MNLTTYHKLLFPFHHNLDTFRELDYSNVVSSPSKLYILINNSVLTHDTRVSTVSHILRHHFAF